MSYTVHVVHAVHNRSHRTQLDKKQEHAKVCDVGLAKVKDEELSGAVGTYLWMPPEMMIGTHYTEKADVYRYRFSRLHRTQGSEHPASRSGSIAAA